MQIAIVDDNPSDREELKNLLSKYMNNKKLDAHYTEFCCSEDFLTDFEANKYDLVFLDIYMGKTSGMDAARKIYNADTKCRLVFFTTSYTHAVESYDVRAAYYLTKPLVYERLKYAMDSFCEDLIQKNQYIDVHIGHVKTRILLHNILYVDCLSRKTQIHLIDQVITVIENITLITETLLGDERFLCCNRNIIVNMQHIKNVGQDCFEMIDGQFIPIRQRKKISVKNIYLEYSLRDMRKERP